MYGYGERALRDPLGQTCSVRWYRGRIRPCLREMIKDSWIFLSSALFCQSSAPTALTLLRSLLRIYYPTPEFPEGGRITLGFEHLTIGDSIELKGPIGNFIWKGRGIATFNHQDIRVSEIGLICAGSGITPILQVLRAILSDPLSCQDEKLKTKVWVLDVNRYFEDILCKDEIDRLARENEELVKVQYSLTGKDVPDGWEYSKGRITVEMLIKHLPSPGKEKVVCICGPHPMEQNVIGMC